MKIRVIYGAPCSGKTTLAKKKMTSASILWDHDRVLRAMTNQENREAVDNPASPIVRTLRRELLYQLSSPYNEEAVEDIDQCILLTDYPSQRLMDEVNEFENVEYIKCDVSMEECLARLQRDEQRPDKDEWERIIREWFEKHGDDEPIKQPERAVQTAMEERNMATPDEKIKFKDSSQSRSLTLLKSIETEKRLESDYYVEGYAAKFAPYILYEDVDGPVYEQFDRNCFDGCDMSDIIMLFDHAGRVYARNSNGTLLVGVDDVGLFFAADLSRTKAARELYADFKAEMITKASWRFALGDYEYVPKTRTILHHSVRKIYDISAVSIPANKNTEINARSWVDGVIGAAARSEAELEDRRRKLRIKLLMEG